MSSAAPYEMTRTPETCADTERPLEIGELHIAALIELPDDSPLQRVLYSMDAWERGVTLPEGASIFGFWKRRVPDPGEPDTHALVSDDEIMDLFEQLGESDQDSKIVFRYLLSLMLLRKKRLELERMIPAEKGERAKLVMRQKVKGGGGPLFEVIDPAMDDEAVAQGIEDLGRVIALDSAP
jgi:hypothetical protein